MFKGNKRWERVLISKSPIHFTQCACLPAYIPLVCLGTYRCRGAPARSTCLLVRTDNSMKAHSGPCSDPDFNHECQNHLFIKMLLCKPPKGIAFDTKPISSKCFFFDRRCYNTKILFLLSCILQGVQKNINTETLFYTWAQSISCGELL